MPSYWICKSLTTLERAVVFFVVLDSKCGLSLKTSLHHFLDLPQSHPDFNEPIQNSFRQHCPYLPLKICICAPVSTKTVFLSCLNTLVRTCQNLFQAFYTSKDSKTVQEELANAWEKRGYYPNFTVIQRNFNKSKCIPSTCLKFNASFIPETLL